MTLTYDVTDRVLTDQYAAVVRGRIPRHDLPVWLRTAFGQVNGYLRWRRLAPAGPPFARYTFLGDMIDVEAGFPVPCEIARCGRVEPSRLPRGPAAVTTHYGPCEDLEHAYAAIRRWLITHGRAPVGVHWEVFRSDPAAEPDPARWRTDVVVPYRVG